MLTLRTAAFELEMVDRASFQESQSDIHGVVDYGLAGVLFPVALYLMVEGKPSHAIWFTCMLVGLNSAEMDDPSIPLQLLDAFAVGAGSILILLAATVLNSAHDFYRGTRCTCSIRDIFSSS